MKFYYGIILFLLSFSNSVFGQKVLPPIYNYKIFDYNAASQNWDVAVDDSGALYASNNKGLLYYNGEEWVLNKLPNKTIIRSVTIVEDKIYTGSYEEFGYWQKNEFGLLEYTSLTHLIKNYTFTNEEFWQIISFNDAIVFRSFSSIYIYKNNEIKVIDADVVVTNLVTYKDELYVGTNESGIYKLKEDALVQLPNTNIFFDKTVIAMAVVDNDLLIGTKLNGCYLLKDGVLKEWNNEVNEELKKHQLNDIAPYPENKIAFGTIKKGVYLHDLDTNKYVNLDRETGLQNNTVLSIFHFDNQLWLGLDNGIDRIKTNAPITYYTDFSGLVGTLYDIAYLDDVIYLGSNTGIYYFDNNQLQFVENSQGHVWDLTVVDGELFAGHNTGTYKIDKNQLDKISSVSGGYQLIKVPEQENIYYQGTYVGISKFLKNEDNIWNVVPVKGIQFPVKQLCFESANVLWVAHPYKGFYRLHLNKNLDEIVEIEEFNNDAISSNYNVKVYNVKNQIVFYADGIWYKFNSIANKIEVFEDFQKFNKNELIYNDEEFFWFINNDENKEITYTNLRDKSLAIAENVLKKRLVPDAENVIKVNDSIYLLTLNDGFAKVNLNKLNNYLGKFKIPKPQLSYFKDENNRFSLKEKTFKIKYKNSQNISFQVSSPNIAKPHYFYELSGVKEQSMYVDEGTIDFQNLPHGNYKVQVSTVSIDGETSEPINFSFEISPPWYLSSISKVIYVFVLIGIFFIIRFYNLRKLARKQKSFEEKMDRKQEEHLAFLEKEKLAKEIKSKQQELTSTALNIAKKNEVILELKNMMVMNKDKFTSSSRYGSFIKKIDKSVNDTEDWKKFEVNFKQLHEDFFERLLKEYPKLTPKDLKLCAYLKMNLSSKEIAPLMGISLRGVEIHRYRLRKKLQIDTSEYLSSFLITF
ncbi:Two component regulator three Y domain-containing protein [Cellulophaga sp. HaHaR_3_176]|uniref:helix-turn-helix and ligand-binding sensor domain-containing protein n=1 Tax=Cellulophaga sp. HaHaR_3_176 TaxID=1942464 RepID=UPI001C1F29A4|nr:Two component regulator three Y domain-containing protein [Cellulophaga sp. HaHaR_3_176]QWX83846.1 Two component regulator three Y domain-containing protein [Cellulophaga sp. HaHaR_3_176]